MISCHQHWRKPPKKNQLKTSNKLKQTNNELKQISNNNSKKLVKVNTLADSKIELVNVMMDNGNEKHKFEIEILKTQLQKEKLQVEITQKELELKTLILEREERLRNESQI